MKVKDLIEQLKQIELQFPDLEVYASAEMYELIKRIEEGEQGVQLESEFFNSYVVEDASVMSSFENFDNKRPEMRIVVLTIKKMMQIVSEGFIEEI
ncbi:MAG TPA: hypothetical protein PKY59_08170 [Pyrinomonadaceae bacterium]|nr:hypothetical protein [Pyrinomonadaceae bacterium]